MGSTLTRNVETPHRRLEISMVVQQWSEGGGGSRSFWAENSVEDFKPGSLCFEARCFCLASDVDGRPCSWTVEEEEACEFHTYFTRQTRFQP